MLEFLILVLATFRITEMIVVDEGPFDMFVRWRAFLVRNAHKSKLNETLAKLFDCKFCMGIWVSLLVVLMTNYGLGLLVFIFAIAGAQSVILQFLEK